MAAYGSEEINRSRPNLPTYAPEFSGISQQAQMRQGEIDRRRRDLKETSANMDDYYRTAGDLALRAPLEAVNNYQDGARFAEEQQQAKDRRRDSKQAYDMNNQVSEENRMNLEKQRMENDQAQRYRQFMDQPSSPGGPSRQEASWQLGVDQPFKAEKRSEEEFAMRKREFNLTERQINSQIAAAQAQVKAGKIETAVGDLAEGYATAYAIQDKAQQDAEVAKIDAQAREILPPSKIMVARRAGKQGALTDVTTERLSRPQIQKFEAAAETVRSEGSLLESMMDRLAAYKRSKTMGVSTQATIDEYERFAAIAEQAFGANPDDAFGYDARRPFEISSENKMERFIGRQIDDLERKVGDLRKQARNDPMLLNSSELQNAEMELEDIKRRFGGMGYNRGAQQLGTAPVGGEERSRTRLIQGGGGNQPPPGAPPPGVTNQQWLTGGGQPPRPNYQAPPLPQPINFIGKQPMAPAPAPVSARDKQIHRQTPARNFQGGR